MAKDVQILLESLLSEAREQTAWLRLIGLQAAEGILQIALRTPKQRLVYQLSDGRGVREIADEAGVGVGTVSRLWTEWAALGIVRESPRQRGRWEHLAPAAALSLESSSR